MAGDEDDQGGRDADLLVRYRGFCEAVSRPMVEGREPVAADVRDSLELAPPELVADLELLMETMERVAEDPSYSDSRAGGASYRVGRWIESIGFDPVSFVRNARRRANRSAASHLSAARRDIGEVASSSIGAIDVEHADEIVAGALVATFEADAAARTELWRALRASAESTGRWPVYIGEGIAGLSNRVAASDAMARAEQLDGSALLEVAAESPTIASIADQDRDGAGSNGPAAHDVLGDRYRSLLLLPARASAEAMAHLAPSFGSIPPHEHVAIVRHFGEVYGAALAAIDGATIELLLPSPPTGSALVQAVQDRQAYGDATYGATQLDSSEEILLATERDRCWGFWFD